MMIGRQALVSAAACQPFQCNTCLDHWCTHMRMRCTSASAMQIQSRHQQQARAYCAQKPWQGHAPSCHINNTTVKQAKSDVNMSLGLYPPHL